MTGASTELRERLLRNLEKDVLNPMPDGPTVHEEDLDRERRFSQINHRRALALASNEAMPKEMRLFFLATQRADAVGHAIFEPRELEELLGCRQPAVSKVLARGKECGLFEFFSTPQHIFLVGVMDGSVRGQQVARDRFVKGIGYPGPGKGWS